MEKMKEINMFSANAKMTLVYELMFFFIKINGKDQCNIDA